jgi:hypothetical protein
LPERLQNARQLLGCRTDCRVAGACSLGHMRLDLSYTYDALDKITLTHISGGSSARNQAARGNQDS